MTEAIIVAAITAAAGVLCQVLVAMRSASLTAFRIERLEEKVGKHNNMIERLYKLEERAKSNTHRLDELERGE
ncbi:MAG: hypothetical protein RR829_05025 [Oscillospiraceae bacterium]